MGVEGKMKKGEKGSGEGEGLPLLISFSRGSLAQGEPMCPALAGGFFIVSHQGSPSHASVFLKILLKCRVESL